MKWLIIFAAVLHLGWPEEIQEPFQIPDRCTETVPDQGTGSEYLENWYYSPADKMCKEFMYSGQGGNANRFDTKEACERECRGSGGAQVSDQTETAQETSQNGLNQDSTVPVAAENLPSSEDQTQTTQEASESVAKEDANADEDEDDDGYTDGVEDDDIIAKYLDTDLEMTGDDGEALRGVMAAYGAEILKPMDEQTNENTDEGMEDETSGDEHDDVAKEIVEGQENMAEGHNWDNAHSDEMDENEDETYPDGSADDKIIRQYIKSEIDGNDEEMLKEAMAAYGADTLVRTGEDEPEQSPNEPEQSPNEPKQSPNEPEQSPNEPEQSPNTDMETESQYTARPHPQDAEEGDHDDEDDGFTDGEEDDALIHKYLKMDGDMSADDSEMLREAMAAYEVSAMKEEDEAESDLQSVQKELTEDATDAENAGFATGANSNQNDSEDDGDDDENDDDDDETPDGIDLDVDYPALKGIADADDQQALTDVMSAYDVVEAVTDGREITEEVLARLPMDQNTQTETATIQEESEKSGFVNMADGEEMDPVDEIENEGTGTIFNPGFRRPRPNRRGRGGRNGGQTGPTQGPTKEITFMLPVKDQPPNVVPFNKRPTPRSPMVSVREEVSTFAEFNRDFVPAGPPPAMKSELKPIDVIPPFSPLHFLLLRALTRPRPAAILDMPPTPPPIGLPFNPRVRIFMPPTLAAHIPMMQPPRPMPDPRPPRPSDEIRDREEKRNRKYERDYEFGRRHRNWHDDNDRFDHREQGRMFVPNFHKTNLVDASRADNRHVNNVTPNNKFTLLQVFIDKQHKMHDNSKSDKIPERDMALPKLAIQQQNHGLDHFNRPPMPFSHLQPYPTHAQNIPQQQPQQMPQFPQQHYPQQHYPQQHYPQQHYPQQHYPQQHYHQSPIMERPPLPFMPNPIPMQPLQQPIPQGHIHPHQPEPYMRRPEPDMRRPEPDMWRPEPDMRRPEPDMRRPMLSVQEQAGDSDDYDDELSPDVCMAPLAPGHCKSYETKWYYNRDTNTCEIFYYTGCGGSSNRFETWEECAAVCVDMPEGSHSTTTELEPEEEEDERPDTIVFTSTVLPQTVQEAEQAAREAALEAEQAAKEAALEAEQAAKEVALESSKDTEQEVARDVAVEQFANKENEETNQPELAANKEISQENADDDGHMSREYIILLAVMATVGLAVVILVTMAVVHLCRRNRNRKEKELQAVINHKLYGDHMNVYTTGLPSDIPAKA